MMPLRALLLLSLSALALACTPPGANLKDVAISECKAAIEERLKSPASAQYPVLEAKQDILAKTDGGILYEVRGKVDSANSFGALLRNDFGCAVDFRDRDKPETAAFIGEELFVNTDLLKALNKAKSRYHWSAQYKIRAAKQKQADRKPADVVSWAEFEKLRKGMPLTRIQRIVGHEGVKVEGESGLRDEAYRWENYDGSYLVVFFEDGEAFHMIDEGLW